MDSKGKNKAATSEKLEDRPEDFTYFAFLCNIEPKDVDVRILQEHLAVSFSLKLPLSIYDVNADAIVETINNSRGCDLRHFL